MAQSSNIKRGDHIGKAIEALKAHTPNSGNGVLVSCLTILFVYLKLTKQIDWSWWWVLSPFMGLCFAAILAGIIWAWIDS